MIQEINGLTKIGENEIPFSFDKQKELIKLYTSSKPVTISDEVDTIIGEKYCFHSTGTVLFKLNIPLSILEFCDQISAVEYFIEDYEIGSRYTGMKLRFPELDYFIPSANIAKVHESNIIFSRHKETKYNFSINFRNSIISVSFNKSLETHICVDTKTKTVSELSITFPETNDLEYISDLYLSVRSFFVFVCNRQNIGLRGVTLIGKYPKKTIRERKIVDELGDTRQKMFFSQKYLEPLEDIKQLNKVPDSALFASKLKELFEMFFVENESDTAIADDSSIHASFKYRNLIDLKQSLHITATFEKYVRTLLPTISSQSTLDFFKEINTLLDDYIEKANGKKKKKAKEFKKFLKPQISLDEKIIKVFNGYASWKPLVPILSEWFGSNISELAIAARLWRNELAHEKRELEPDQNTITAIRLVEHMNYCIVLRYAGYSDIEIIEILSKVLTR